MSNKNESPKFQQHTWNFELSPQFLFLFRSFFLACDRLNTLNSKYDCQDYKQRTDAFSAALHENRCESLIGIIKAVSMKKQRFREKQQYNVDNNFMKRAMNLLCGELAYVLEQPFDEMRTTVERSVHDAIQAERKARREASAAERAAEAAQAEQERTDADANEA